MFGFYVIPVKRVALNRTLGNFANCGCICGRESKKKIEPIFGQAPKNCVMQSLNLFFWRSMLKKYLFWVRKNLCFVWQSQQEI